MNYYDRARVISLIVPGIEKELTQHKDQERRLLAEQDRSWWWRGTCLRRGCHSVRLQSADPLSQWRKRFQWTSRRPDLRRSTTTETAPQTSTSIWRRHWSAELRSTTTWKLEKCRQQQQQQTTVTSRPYQTLGRSQLRRASFYSVCCWRTAAGTPDAEASWKRFRQCPAASTRRPTSVSTERLAAISCSLDALQSMQII